MKKTKFFIFYFFIFLVVSLTAMPLVQSQLTFNPNEPAEIKVSCFDLSHDFCDATTNCNITIYYPNMSILTDNQEMTNNLNYFNYTTPPLNERGEYHAVVACEDSGSYGYTSFSFISTSIPATSQGNVAIGILISLVGLAFLFIFVGFKFADTEKLFPIALFFILLSLTLGVYILQLGYLYSRDILVSSMTTTMQFKIYLGIMYGLVGIVFISLLFLIVKTLKEFKIRKSIKEHGKGWDPKLGVYK